MSELIITVAQGQLPVALLLTALGSIVLGMGLPTTAAYVVLAALGGADHLRAQDWPQWRGPQRDGRAGPTALPTAWPEAPSRSWRVEVGTGHASPLVAGDRIYLHTRRDDGGQGLDAGGGAVELAAAVVGDHKAVGAVLHGALRLGRVQDPLDDQGARPEPAQPIDVAPR